ncbi:hypothetical protein A4A49_00843 [Nicotiana attenuata]|uniref:Uncharacterized protein n=1 Tax=Nicotiana attenuata TaxID=49451 RepID=A0A1J6I2P1_NICAT|nr:hypothetical protein A4A49_00843 [Nicotiana attenuata]
MITEKGISFFLVLPQFLVVLKGKGLACDEITRRDTKKVAQNNQMEKGNCSRDNLEPKPDSFNKKKKRNRRKKQNIVVEEEDIDKQANLVNDQIAPKQIEKETKNSKTVDIVNEQTQEHTQKEIAPSSIPEDDGDMLNTQVLINKAVYEIDTGDTDSNYLKLICGTDLETKSKEVDDDLTIREHPNSSEMGYHSSEDMDYADDESSETSEEYASVDSEEDNSDEHADRLVAAVTSHSMVEVNVTAEYGEVANIGHLSNRGRGMGQQEMW